MISNLLIYSNKFLKSWWSILVVQFRVLSLLAQLDKRSPQISRDLHQNSRLRSTGTPRTHCVANLLTDRAVEPRTRRPLHGLHGSVEYRGFKKRLTRRNGTPCVQLEPVGAEIDTQLIVHDLQRSAEPASDDSFGPRARRVGVLPGGEPLLVVERVDVTQRWVGVRQRDDVMSDVDARPTANAHEHVVSALQDKHGSDVITYCTDNKLIAILRH